jgi:hypothetical protein
MVGTIGNFRGEDTASCDQSYLIVCCQNDRKDVRIQVVASVVKVLVDACVSIHKPCYAIVSLRIHLSLTNAHQIALYRISMIVWLPKPFASTPPL